MSNYLETTDKTIHLIRVTETIDGIPGFTRAIQIQLCKHETTENFKTLVQRAMNTWPDAPAELKEFADLLLEGKILQDYKSQG